MELDISVDVVEGDCRFHRREFYGFCVPSFKRCGVIHSAAGR